jgi:hypothetical protein
MNENDITITLTESQHELLNEVLNHAVDAINLASPYGDGMWDLPLDNPIVQRYTMLENMKEMFFELWRDRFADIQP